MPSNQRNLGVTRDPADTEKPKRGRPRKSDTVSIDNSAIDAVIASAPAAPAGKKTRTRNIRRDIVENAPAALASAQQLVIDQPTIAEICLEVTGDAPLIQNKFSQKAVEMMLRQHMGHSVQREKKVPRQVLEDATVKNMDGLVSMPPTAFKLAKIGAAGLMKGLKKTQLRLCIFIVGNSVPLRYAQNVPRMDITRTSGIGRTPDVRFRPSFHGWSARILIRYNNDILSPQTVIDLLNRAGNGGVGEWRPERNGNFGTFHVTRHIADPVEIGEVQALCAVGLQELTIPDWALDASIDPEVLSKIFSGQSDAQAPADPSKIVALEEGEDGAFEIPEIPVGEEGEANGSAVTL